MDHHVDIDVLPDPEFPANQLMSALYANLHRALVGQSSTRIGVSFPRVEPEIPTLGSCLRVHGDLASLLPLLELDWLRGMRDHVAMTLPTPVPDAAEHRVVRRLQFKSSPDRLRRRLMRRHCLDAQEAHQRIPDGLVCFARLPFLQLRSASTGQNFKLFVDHGPLTSVPILGDFNAYGLSQRATVPWF